MVSAFHDILKVTEASYELLTGPVSVMIIQIPDLLRCIRHCYPSDVSLRLLLYVFDAAVRILDLHGIKLGREVAQDHRAVHVTKLCLLLLLFLVKSRCLRLPAQFIYALNKLIEFHFFLHVNILLQISNYYHRHYILFHLRLLHILYIFH